MARQARARALVALAAALAGALVLGACSVSERAGAAGTSASTSTTERTTTTAPPTTKPTTTQAPTTTEPTTTTEKTTTTTKPEPVVLRPGARGDKVKELQERLKDLGYQVPKVDGVYGGETAQAVLAFQKLNGLSRDGLAGPRTRKALEDPKQPSPKSKAGGFHVEADLAHQVVYLVRDGRITLILNASSGSGDTYTSQSGDTVVAHTPRGDFEVERKINGWRTSYLGQLYRPAYFRGGYALHGSPSVPAYPASHGCIRVSIAAMDRIYDKLPVGTPMLVYG